MDIVVTSGCIIYKKKNHLPGDIIRGMDNKEADRLINLGKAKTADEDKSTKAEPKKKA